MIKKAVINNVQIWVKEVNEKIRSKLKWIKYFFPPLCQTHSKLTTESLIMLCDLGTIKWIDCDTQNLLQKSSLYIRYNLLCEISWNLVIVVIIFNTIKMNENMCKLNSLGDREAKCPFQNHFIHVILNVSVNILQAPSIFSTQTCWHIKQPLSLILGCLLEPVD